ncbi:hypothetical protein SYNPS1DRAFT_25438, partial [Syncephalis pseudoplumigaleata]
MASTFEISIANRHPHLMLRRFFQYCSVGGCLQMPSTDVRPMDEITAKFKANITRNKLNGCMICRIDVAEGTLSGGKDLCVLLAWKINVGGQCYFLLDLVENQKDLFIWSEDELEKYYRTIARQQVKTTSEGISRTWFLDSKDQQTNFTIHASMSDVREGKITVGVEAGAENGDRKPPRVVQTEDFDWSRWSDDGIGCIGNLIRMNVGCNMTVFVDNAFGEVLLCYAAEHIFEGKSIDAPDKVGPRSRAIIKMESEKTLCACIVYELRRASDPATPLLWGRRVYLVIDTHIAPRNSSKRKAGATLLAVKDSAFPRCDNSISSIHDEIQQYITARQDQPAQWRLDGFDLQIGTVLRLEPHAKMYIKLERARGTEPRDFPAFLCTNDYSVPSRNTMDVIKRENLVKPGHVLVENCTDLELELVCSASGADDEHL